MQRGILSILFILGFFVVFSQENNLDNFVESQQNKLIYDESKLIQAPNTNVFIIPPEHFIQDAGINGFVHPGSATTIQVIEVPGKNLKQLINSMTDEYITEQGYTFIGKEEIITESGNPAILYFVQFTSNELEYERIMFFTGDENLIWININYPLTIKKLIYPAVEACLKSVQEA